MFWCCVNLPRWGLKQFEEVFITNMTPVCKFTPLGFETLLDVDTRRTSDCVNLPRWGLKPKLSALSPASFAVCKFTPLGFETLPLRQRKYVPLSCKFTPLGFETILNNRQQERRESV